MRANITYSNENAGWNAVLDCADVKCLGAFVQSLVDRGVIEITIKIERPPSAESRS